jgi:hypothetical protein
LNHEIAEYTETAAQLGWLGGPSEAVEAKVEPVPEPEVFRSKPEPLPTIQERPTTQETPVIEEQEQIAAVVEPAPVQTTEPTPRPTRLPKTASPMGLIGLIGLVSMTGYVTRFFRH